VHSTSRVPVVCLSLEMWLPCILLISILFVLTKGKYGNESPSTVLIFTKEQEYLAYPLPHCCGTILSQDTVITAANCFGTGTVHANNFFLVAGDLQSYLYSGPNTTDSRYSYKSQYSPQKIDMEKIIIHPHYIEGNKEVDLAIIKLSTKLETNSDVEIARLPPPGAKHEGKSVEFTYLVVGENVEIPERGLPKVELEKETLTGHDGCLDYYEIAHTSRGVQQYLGGSGAIFTGWSSPLMYGMFVSGSTLCKIGHVLPWVYREAGVSPAYEIFLDDQDYDDYLSNTQENPFIPKPGIDDKYLYLNPTQILHLPSFEQLPCKQHFPNELHGASAAVVPYHGVDRLMICGGQIGFPQRRGCLILTESGWQKSSNTFERAAALSSKLADGSWLVTGGFMRRGPSVTSSKLYYNDEWTDSISLPYEIRSFCQVSVGNQTFVIGGFMDVGTSNYVLVLNKDSVTELPHNLTYPRAFHACVEWGGQIYVIGGLQLDDDGNTQHIVPTVEVYNPSTPDLGWFTGPELPHGLLGANAVVHEDTLYLVGGQTSVIRLEQSPDYNTAVFKLDKDGEEWKILPGVSVMAGIMGRGMPFTLDQHAPVVDGNTLHCF